MGIAWGIVPGNLWRGGGGKCVLDMVLLATRDVVAEGSRLVPGSQCRAEGWGLMGWCRGEETYQGISADLIPSRTPDVPDGS